MRIVTYLSFTLLSVLIQFSVMDFIQSIMQMDEKLIENSTSQKRQLRDVLKDLDYKPHALFYRTQMSKLAKASAKIYDNTTLPYLLSTTETPGVLEILYDDSTSSTEEEDTSITTEAVNTSTEFDNVTEITFIVNTNQTQKPDIKQKKKENKNCKCNLLFGVCDINCCCDVECSEAELRMFLNCNKNVTKYYDDDVCYSHLFYFGQDSHIASVLNNWFCIVKINLPERPVENKKIHTFTGNNFFTWKSIEKPQSDYEFKNKMYQYGDPIWLIKNESIYYVDVAVPVMNNYCTGRKTIQFLKNYKNRCTVKISDLDMFQIVKSTEEASVISASPISMNSTYLNCSSLHCVNWTLIICENLICTNYNKTIHEPVCTETICTNLALKLEYIFNYHDSKITNATIKFHVQNVQLHFQYFVQEIDVKFILVNESIDRALKLSGNPGYLDGLPLIVSYSESNYTNNFYNRSSQLKTYFTLPESKSGTCAASDVTDNFILFGSNRSIKCRYHHKSTKVSNNSEQCLNIQTNINRLLDLTKVAVSPLGEPKNIEDADWIPIYTAIKVSDNALLYGELHKISSKLYCYNIITRYSFVFIYAELAGNNRILDIKLGTTKRNASFNIDDMSIVVTVDINFVDVSKPGVVRASHPSLNLYLPNDFFLPSNESQVVSINVFCLILYFCVALLTNK